MMIEETRTNHATQERALVQRAIAGETVVLEILLAPKLGKLYRVAFSMLRNREDAEDAVQDGLYNAFRRLPSFEGRSSFSTWLTRIVMNSALMILRRKRSRSESSLDEILSNQPERLAQLAVDKRRNPEQICAMVEANALIEQRLMKLPTPEQAAFRHYAIGGHSIRESSLTFGVSESAFKSRIMRTRRKVTYGIHENLSHRVRSTPDVVSPH